MPKFRVMMSRMVRETSEFLVEAATVEEAKGKAQEAYDSNEVTDWESDPEWGEEEGTHYVVDPQKGLIPFNTLQTQSKQMPKFHVLVPEIHRQTVEIEAATHEDAVMLVCNGEGDYLKDSLHYRCTLDGEDTPYDVINLETGKVKRISPVEPFSFPVGGTGEEDTDDE